MYTCELMRLNLCVSSSQVTLQTTHSDKLATAQGAFLGSRLLVLPPGQMISCHLDRSFHDKLSFQGSSTCVAPGSSCVWTQFHTLGRKKPFPCYALSYAPYVKRFGRNLKIFSVILLSTKWSPWCRWPRPCTWYTPTPGLLCAAFGRDCKKLVPNIHLTHADALH